MQAFRPIWAEVGKTEKLKTIKELIHMTTKQLQEYANKALENYNGVAFDVNTEHYIRPWAAEGEKYTLYFVNTFAQIASANNIYDAKEIIDNYVSREQELEKEALKYAC